MLLTCIYNREKDLIPPPAPETGNHDLQYQVFDDEEETSYSIQECEAAVGVTKLIKLLRAYLFYQ